MKDFIKMTLAVICGMIIVLVVGFFLCLGFLGAALAAGSGTPVLPKSGVLVLDMSKTIIAEQTQESSPLSTLSGKGNASIIGIWDAVQAINSAAADPAVKFIYLKPDNSSSGVAELQEIRIALQHFRQTSGKPVIAYTESPTTGSYYLASVADKVYMTSYLGANSMISGVSTQMMFFGDLLNRLGVNVQLIRHGKYKSAGETYTRSASSPENREQYQRLVDSIWESLSAEIAESRDISVSELNRIIDNLELVNPQDFLDRKLVDELLTGEQLQDRLTVLAMADKFKDVKMFSLADYAAAKATVSKVRQKIAIIYADGEIVDGNSRTEVAGDRFANLISKVAADSTIKAIVLRVNSPGGSVIASEKIKSAIDAIPEKVPVIASYGSYAASGGYWISNSCDRIFSDKATLTGSIGVFGMIPEFSKTAKDVLHVGVETVSSNKHGDMYSLMRPFDNAEYNSVLKSIETVYDRFTTIVSEGRSIPKETVDAIGRGRVWTGADALTINLVDQTGTLEDAVMFAARAAGDEDLASWNIQSFPRVPSQLETLMSMMNGADAQNDVLSKLYKNLTTPGIFARMDTELNIK